MNMNWICLLDHTAGAHVARAIVGLGGVAHTHPTATSRVNEFECAITIGFGDNAHMPNATASYTTVEKHKVARLELVASDATAIVDLPTWTAIEAHAKLAKHIAREARAVKATGAWCSKAIGSASKLESIVKQNLPRTYGHINSDEADDFDIEEYTYTGDTYITAIDLYFDKSDGSLKKYTQTFTIEGSDDTVSEYTVDELSGDADDSLFDVSQATSLVDFDSMSEDQRLGYCQGIFNKAGVTTDNLSAGGYQTDDLKTISYDSFVSLVYTYGYKSAQQ